MKIARILAIVLCLVSGIAAGAFTAAAFENHPLWYVDAILAFASLTLCLRGAGRLIWDQYSGFEYIGDGMAVCYGLPTVLSKWWTRTRPVPEGPIGFRSRLCVVDSHGYLTAKPRQVEFYTPWWAWPLELLHRVTFGNPKLHLPEYLPLSTRDEPDQTRDMRSHAITVRAATIDTANRSVEAVMSTPQPVAVMDWDRYEVIDEVLVSDGGDYPTQMPLLECHARYSLDNVLGSIRNIRRDGENWVGRLFFAADNDRADQAWELVRQGHVTDVSIGYRSTKFIDIPAGQSGVVNGKTYTASSERGLRITTAYTAKECSLVPIGADSKAKVRGEGVSSPKTPLAGNPRMELQMNPQLRKYLESLGLRATSTDAEAEAFRATLTGEVKTRADAVIAGTMTFEAARAADVAMLNEYREALKRGGPGIAAPATPVTDANRQQETPDQLRQAAATAERARITEIHQMAGSEVPAETVTRAINDGWTTERFATEALNHVRASRSPAVGADPSITVGLDKTRAATELALAAAIIGNNATRHAAAFAAAVQPNDVYREIRSADAWNQAVTQSRRYAALGARDVLRTAIALSGGRYDLTEGPETLMRRAVSGGSASNIFTTSAYAVLMIAWDETTDSTVGWVGEGDVENFLTHDEIDFQTNAGLKKLARGQEAEHSDVSDSSNSFKLFRYAKQFSVTEEDVIDDRFGQLLKAPEEHGKAARRLRPQLVYSLLNQNPTFGGAALFNNAALTSATGHANLGATALSADGMKTGINLMGKQYIKRGKEIVQLNLAPETLIVSSALQWTARELLGSTAIIVAGTTDRERGTMNVLNGSVKRLVVDDAISAVGTYDPSGDTVRTGSDTQWFLAAAPGRTIEVNYRRGTGRAPQLRSFVLDKGKWGIGWDINLDIEAHVKDFRGLVKGNS